MDQLNPTQNMPSVQSQPVGMFAGRISRMGYFLGVVYAVLPLLATMLLFAIVQFFNSQSVSSSDMLFSQPSPIVTILNVIIFLLGALTAILIIPVAISLHIRRWHDLNCSGWYTLLSFIPLVSIIAVIYLFFAPGASTPNQFGQPLEPPFSPKKVLFGR